MSAPILDYRARAADLLKRRIARALARVGHAVVETREGATC